MPFMFLGRMAYGWGGCGMVMNFGDSGPIEAIGAVFVNVRSPTKGFGDLHRVIKLTELVCIKGGIAGCSSKAVCWMGVEARKGQNI